MADIIINPKKGQRIGDYEFSSYVNTSGEKKGSFKNVKTGKYLMPGEHTSASGYHIYNNMAVPFGYKSKSATKWIRSRINKYSQPQQEQVERKSNQGGQKSISQVPQNLLTQDQVKDAYLLTQGFTDKPIPETLTNPTPKVSPIGNQAPLPAPFFGYRTNNTYGDSDFRNKLETLGIRSNADLINFGWRTQGTDYDWKGNDWAKQFRSDLDRILGKNWSDENIRRAFNTSGKWGRGFLGSGDFSDFQKSLQESAGVWNSDYDRRKVDYENSLANQQKSPKWLPQIQNSINSLWTTYTPSWRNNLQGVLNLSLYKKGGALSPRNPVERFKSFFRKEAVSLNLK